MYEFYYLIIIIDQSSNTGNFNNDRESARDFIITSQDNIHAIKQDKVQTSYFDVEFSENGDANNEQSEIASRYQQLRNYSTIMDDNNSSVKLLREAMMRNRSTKEISPTYE